MNNKRGAISLSFGMIFSIIIIIAIIGVAFYAINFFLGLSKCTQISLFLDDFDNTVEEAWNSEITKEVFTANVPGGIKAVCFREPGSIGSGKEYEALSDYFVEGGNMFIYPPENACEQASRTAKHLNLEGVGWECFPVRDGEFEIPLKKESFDSLVRLER